MELHCHSAFSFLDGASSTHQLAETAAELGYPSMALTDHDGVWGSMEFAVDCRSVSLAKGVELRAITGAELTVRDGGRLFHLTLLAESAAGYHNLCRLLTEAHSHTRDGGARRTPGQPWLRLDRLEGRTGGLVCLSGCAGNGLIASAFADGDLGRGERLAGWLLETFGPEGLRIELQRPFWRHDRARNRWLSGLARRLGVPTVATGNVHAHHPSRAHLQDALTAIRLGTTLEGSEAHRRGNSSACLASPERMAARFGEHPEAVAETVALAERLRFDLVEEVGYRYPRDDDPEAGRDLARLCERQLELRYAGRASHAGARARLAEELAIIESKRLSGFFLLHHEMLNMAREVALEVRGPDSARSLLPPGRGRGSSVSSIVCYLTGLSHIDPVEAELFSGRFLHEDVDTVPDIDLDFPRDIRERLIPLVHERYGRDRSALVAAFPTYRSRGAVRDLGKALGMPAAEMELVARTVDFHGAGGEIERDLEAALGPDRSRSLGWRHLARLCEGIAGLPRHASQHSGGMIISTHPLDEVCPIVPAAMEGRQIIQWDKDSCLDAGFLKIDLLGLGMLSAVERCVEEIRRTRGEAIDLSRIPLDDGPTYEAIQKAETTGVFQIESRAQMQMLPRTHPESLEDLTIQVALVRPGPIQGGAVHPYIERRKRLREDPDHEIDYLHPSLKRSLEETLGTIVYQEQVIQVAMDMAGFSARKAEGLRRAMSRKRSKADLESYHEDFVRGAVANGVDAGLAEQVYSQVVGFAGFGFPKAHSAAFGLLAYQSTWLRVHYGPEFLASLLNEQPMGFYPPDSLVQEAGRRGIGVLPPDVNHSRLDCAAVPAVSGPAVRIGLGYVKGSSEAAMRRLVERRESEGPYQHLEELASRADLGREDLERLAWSGALRSMPGGGRISGLWRVGTLASGRQATRDGQMTLPIAPPQAPSLREPGGWDRVIAEYGSIGMTLEGHPLALMRKGLAGDVLTTDQAAERPDGSRLRVAGLVVARQKPQTARGIVFMLLEDETGTLNVIVPPPLVTRHRRVLKATDLIRADGRLERREGVVNLVAERLSELTPADPAVKAVIPARHSFGRRGR